MRYSVGGDNMGLAGLKSRRIVAVSSDIKGCLAAFDSVLDAVGPAVGDSSLPATSLVEACWLDRNAASIIAAREGAPAGLGSGDENKPELSDATLVTWSTVRTY